MNSRLDISSKRIGSFVMGIENIRCSAKLNAGIDIGNGLKLTNDYRKVKTLSHSNFKEGAGTLETESIKKCGLIAYTEDVEFADIDPLHIVNAILQLVNNFLTTIWFKHEHTAGFDRGYLVDNRGGIHSNILVSSPFNSDGLKDTKILSKQDITSAKLSFRSVTGSVSQCFKVDESRLAIGRSKTLADKSINLPNRFMLFLQKSREAYDPCLRITFCVCALEVIFSTGNNELSHRVSERVAFYLADKLIDRLELYKTIKELYAVRSSFVHGDAIPKKMNSKLTELTKASDDLLRRIGSDLHLNPQLKAAAESGREALDTFHMKNVFGGDQSALTG